METDNDEYSVNFWMRIWNMEEAKCEYQSPAAPKMTGNNFFLKDTIVIHGKLMNAHKSPKCG